MTDHRGFLAPEASFSADAWAEQLSSMCRRVKPIDPATRTGICPLVSEGRKPERDVWLRPRELPELDILSVEIYSPENFSEAERRLAEFGHPRQFGKAFWIAETYFSRVGISADSAMNRVWGIGNGSKHFATGRFPMRLAVRTIAVALVLCVFALGAEMALAGGGGFQGQYQYQGGYQVQQQGWVKPYSGYQGNWNYNQNWNYNRNWNTNTNTNIINVHVRPYGYGY